MSLFQQLVSCLLPPPPPVPPRQWSGHRSRRSPKRSGPHRPHAKRRSGGGKGVVAYHGTPSAANAASIIRHGFMCGSGNGLGDGIYLSTDLAVAKAYAQGGGVYLKCLVQLGRSCTWDTTTNAEFKRWCRDRGAWANNSARTAYLVQHGFHTLMADSVIVVLTPQHANAAAWKRRDWRIKVLSVHRAADDVRIRV